MRRLGTGVVRTGASCNRRGIYSCLRCKICFCDKHVLGKINANVPKGELPKCKKCSFQLQETVDLSMSSTCITCLVHVIPRAVPLLASPAMLPPLCDAVSAR